MIKNIIITVVVSIFLFANAYAQESTPKSDVDVAKQKTSSSSHSFISKNGHEVLPQKGDIGLGIGANSTLQFVGDLMGYAGNARDVTPFDYTNRNYPVTAIYAKYFLNSGTALRLSLNPNFNNNNVKVRVDQDTSLNPDVYTYDQMKIRNNDMLVGIGFEKRRGTSRVQGVMGAELYVNVIGGTYYTYEYGNEISVYNQKPTHANFANLTGVPTPILGYRITEGNIGRSLGIGARGFIGAEYFIAPKFSVGGEFMWGAVYNHNKKSDVTYETWDGTANKIKEYKVETVNNGGLNVGINNAGACVNLHVYF
ncbi:MAG: hypothetical protein SNJ71_01970 [Bacteroidales bacterium]